RRWHLGHEPPIRPPELEAAIRPPRDRVTLLVHGAMVSPTQECEVGQCRRPAVGPMTDVVPLVEAPAAAREATAAVAMLKRSSESRRNRPGPGADFDDTAVWIMAHHHSAGITRQAS